MGDEHRALALQHIFQTPGRCDGSGEAEMGWEYQGIFPGFLIGFRPKNQVAMGLVQLSWAVGLVREAGKTS